MAASGAAIGAMISGIGSSSSRIKRYAGKGFGIGVRLYGALIIFLCFHCFLNMSSSEDVKAMPFASLLNSLSQPIEVFSAKSFGAGVLISISRFFDWAVDIPVIGPIFTLGSYFWSLLSRTVLWIITGFNYIITLLDWICSLFFPAFI